MTVSPGANSGTDLPRRAISSFSSCSMMFICDDLPFDGFGGFSAPLVAISCLAHRAGTGPDVRVLYSRSFHFLPLRCVAAALPLVFGEQRGFLLREPPAFQKLRSPLPRSAQRLLESPTPNFRMVARQ